MGLEEAAWVWAVAVRLTITDGVTGTDKKALAWPVLLSPPPTNGLRIIFSEFDGELAWFIELMSPYLVIGEPLNRALAIAIRHAIEFCLGFKASGLWLIEV